jgi:hypothetical protein
VAVIVGCGEGTMRVGGTPEVPEFRLEPIVRIGALADGPPEYLLSSVYDLEVNPAEREVYVSDGDAQEIRVFTREGEFVRRLGGPGDGPAEFDYAPAFAVARDTVLAFDRTGLHVFSADGSHIRTGRYETPGSYPQPWQVQADRSGWKMLAFEFVPEPNGPMHHRLYRVDISAMQLSDPLAVIEISNEQGLYWDQPQLAMFGDGYVRTEGIEYRLVRHGDGSPSDTLSFAYDPVVPTPADFEDYEAAQRVICENVSNSASCLERMSMRVEAKKAIGLPAHRPVLGPIVGSSDGRLLVERADLDPQPFDDTIASTWDLINDGVVEGRVMTPGGFRVLWFGVDEIWGTETDEFGVPYVVGYRIIAR